MDYTTFQSRFNDGQGFWSLAGNQLSLQETRLDLDTPNHHADFVVAMDSLSDADFERALSTMTGTARTAYFINKYPSLAKFDGYGERDGILCDHDFRPLGGLSAFVREASQVVTSDRDRAALHYVNFAESSVAAKAGRMRQSTLVKEAMVRITANPNSPLDAAFKHRPRPARLTPAEFEARHNQGEGTWALKGGNIALSEIGISPAGRNPEAAFVKDVSALSDSSFWAAAWTMEPEVRAAYLFNKYPALGEALYDTRFDDNFYGLNSEQLAAVGGAEGLLTLVLSVVDDPRDIQFVPMLGFLGAKDAEAVRLHFFKMATTPRSP